MIDWATDFLTTVMTNIPRELHYNRCCRSYGCPKSSGCFHAGRISKRDNRSNTTNKSTNGIWWPQTKTTRIAWRSVDGIHSLMMEVAFNLQVLKGRSNCLQKRFFFYINHAKYDISCLVITTTVNWLEKLNAPHATSASNDCRVTRHWGALVKPRRQRQQKIKATNKNVVAMR